MEIGEYSWNLHTGENFILPLVEVTDNSTNINAATILGVHDKPLPALLAWAGARYSREKGGLKKILNEIYEKNIDWDKKLGDVFVKYGHASVADMASVAVYLHNVPLHVPQTMFNESRTNSGQEHSSRYIQFDDSGYSPLEHHISNCPQHLVQGYNAIARNLLAQIEQLDPVIRDAYNDFFKPTSAAHRNTLKSRTFDTTRFLIPKGVLTGLCFETSLRGWSRIIKSFVSSEDPYYQKIGHHIQTLLAPPADPDVQEILGFNAPGPSLVRHVSPSSAIQDNLRSLKEYLNQTDLKDACPINVQQRGLGTQEVEFLDGSAAELMVMQYILELYPGMDYNKVLHWTQDLSTTQKSEIGAIIFNAHSHHYEIPIPLGDTGSTVAIKLANGEERDFNRHQAFGRNSQHSLNSYSLAPDQHTMQQIIANGYILPLYLEQEPFAKHKQTFVNILDKHYESVGKFQKELSKEYGDAHQNVLVNLLPMAHKSTLFMSGTPRGLAYLVSLREPPGNHVNNQQISYLLREQLASDPFLASLAPQTDGYNNDPLNRERFFSRK